VTVDQSGSERIRRILESSSDPRVARTRDAIAEAVRSLTEQGDVVSVAAIVRTAGISRASFYSHYGGLDELALAMTREAFVAIADSWSRDHEDPVAALRLSQRRLVDHYVDNLALYSAVAALPVSKEAYLSAVRAMAAIIEITIADHPARPPELDSEATARYIASAASGLIDAWLAGDAGIDDDALVEHLIRLLPPWYSGNRADRTGEGNPS
jgi:AcrR family transcriptional regulator